MCAREKAPTLLTVFVLLATLCVTESSPQGAEMPTKPDSLVSQMEATWQEDHASLFDPEPDEIEQEVATGLMELESNSIQQKQQQQQQHTPATAPKLLQAAGPAPAPAPAVVKPVVSMAAKVRAKIENNRVMNEQKKRVIATIENRKTAVEKEINTKAITTAKMEYQRKINSVKQEAMENLNEQINSEKKLKAKRLHHATRTRISIKRTFDRIKRNRHEAMLAVEKKSADLKADLKAKLLAIKQKYQTQEATQAAEAAKKMTALKAVNEKRTKAQLARALVWKKRFDAVKDSDTAEIAVKKVQAQKMDAHLKLKLNQKLLTLHKRTLDELEYEHWIKLHGPAARKFKRLQQREIDRIKYQYRKNHRQTRRKVTRATRLLARRANRVTRDLRAVASKEWNILERKMPQSQEIKSGHRRRYMSKVEKEARNVAGQYGATRDAAEAAVDGVLQESPADSLDFL